MKTRAGFSRAFLTFIFVVFLLLIVTIAIPNFVKSRSRSSMPACVNNLRQIDGAKEQWALENKKSAGTPVVVSEVDAYIKGGAPKCESGGSYTYGAVDALPTCSVDEHTLRFMERICEHPVEATAEARSRACHDRLNLLDALKHRWASENHKQPGDVPRKKDMLGMYRMPTCPEGGVYTIGTVGQPPRCSVPGHTLGEASRR